VGAIPVLGDAFDFVWKSNEMNLNLLDTHAYGRRTPTAGDWLFVSLCILVLVGVALLPLILIFLVFAQIGSRIGAIYSFDEKLAIRLKDLDLIDDSLQHLKHSDGVDSKPVTLDKASEHHHTN